MPAQLLPDTSGVLPVPTLAVLGMYHSGRRVLHAAFATSPNTDLTAALARGERPARWGDQVPVFDMGPPLGFNTVPVHVAGWVAGLTDDEASLLWHWMGVAQGYVTGHAGGPNTANPDYVMYPPYQEVPTEEEGRTRWKFSCCGLVIWCYEQIGIPLIDWSSPAMPVVTDPEVVKFLRMCRRVDQSRLPANRDEWRIVTAGYLFHSLARDEAAVRTQPLLPASQDQLSFPEG